MWVVKNNRLAINICICVSVHTQLIFNMICFWYAPLLDFLKLLFCVRIMIKSIALHSERVMDGCGKTVHDCETIFLFC